MAKKTLRKILTGKTVKAPKMEKYRLTMSVRKNMVDVWTFYVDAKDENDAKNKADELFRSGEPDEEEGADCEWDYDVIDAEKVK